MTWLSPEGWQAVALSLRVALVATVFALPFALAAAYALARGRFWGRGALNAVVHLPLILPPVVTGYVLLSVLSPRAPLGAWLDQFGIRFAFSWTGAALAAGIMGFPLMVRAIRLALESVDPKLEQAASTLGAARWWVFATITLPLTLPGVIAGTVLGFAKALGEFGATITFVSNIPGQTQTLPSAIYAFLQAPGGEAEATKLVIVSVVLAVGALVFSEWLVRRAPRRAHAPSNAAVRASQRPEARQ